MLWHIFVQRDRAYPVRSCYYDWVGPHRLACVERHDRKDLGLNIELGVHYRIGYIWLGERHWCWGRMQNSGLSETDLGLIRILNPKTWRPGLGCKLLLAEGLCHR